MWLTFRKPQCRNVNAIRTYFIFSSYSCSLCMLILFSQHACPHRAGTMATGCFELIAKQSCDWGEKGSSLAAPVLKCWISIPIGQTSSKYIHLQTIRCNQENGILSTEQLGHLPTCIQPRGECLLLEKLEKDVGHTNSWLSHVITVTLKQVDWTRCCCYSGFSMDKSYNNLSFNGS